MKKIIQFSTSAVLLFTVFTYPCRVIAAKPDKKPMDQAIQLRFAARDGDIEKIKSLIADGADVNAKDQGGNRPLHIAAIWGQKNVAELLFANGADINAKNEKGQTPLYQAVFHGKKEMVELLITNGADVNINDKKGEMPLSIAMEAVNEDIVLLLIDAGAIVSIIRSGNEEIMHRAARRSYCKVVKLLLGRGVDVNISNDGMTPLHSTLSQYVYEERHFNMVKLLVDHGAAINKKNHRGLTPLASVIEYQRMFDIDNYQYKIAKFLISKGADVNTKSENGHTVLHWAVYTAHRDTVDLLISKGAEIDSRDFWGGTPLYKAVNYHRDAREGPYKNDLDINMQITAGDFARDMTEIKSNWQPNLKASNALKEIIRLLIKNGADVNVKNEQGDTPLIEAAKGDNKDLVEMLIAGGADVNVKGKNNIAPLENAAKHGRVDIVELLLAEGADVHTLDKADNTLLHWASQSWKDEMVEFLISKGIDVNAKDQYGAIPLGLAVKGQYKKRELPEAKDSNSYYKRGDYFYQKDEFERAIEDYSSAIRLNQENGQAYYQRGIIWAKQDNPRQAVADWKKAIELDWSNALDIYYAQRLLKSPDEELNRIIRNKAINHLADLEYVSGSSVGHFGTPGYFYTISLAISEPFKEEMFLQMAKSDKPVVRAMAMICLARKNLTKYENIIRSFYTDEGEIKCLSYDIVTRIILKQFAKRIIEHRAEIFSWSSFHTDRKFRATEPDSEQEEAVQRQVKVIQTLIAKGADINAKDQDGKTPLHYASEQGSTRIAEVLITDGADVNAKNNKGETPLHCASFWGYQNMVELLMESGADITAKNSKGQTAVDIAAQQDYPGLSALLRGFEMKQ